MRTQFAVQRVNFRFSPKRQQRPGRISGNLWAALFGGIAWPYIELAIRLWIAKLFGFFGFMQMLYWETTLAVASQENPIPFLAPNVAAFLSTAIYIVCAVLLAVGFMTRYAALPLLLLSLITQLRYTPFDTQLFWIALAGWFAIYGAGPISVDNLLRRGLNDSAVPLIPRIIDFLKRLRGYGTPLYILLSSGCGWESLCSWQSFFAFLER